MAEASVEIPSELLARVRDSAVLLYEAAAEGLHLAVRAQPERERPGDAVLRQRERLARLDALLEQAGWWSDREPGAPGAREPIALAGPPDLLQDVLAGALVDAGELLAQACGHGGTAAAGGESIRAAAGGESIRAAAAEVIALDRLAGQVRAGR